MSKAVLRPSLVLRVAAVGVFLYLVRVAPAYADSCPPSGISCESGCGWYDSCEPEETLLLACDSAYVCTNGEWVEK